MSGMAEVLTAHRHNEGYDLDRNIYSWCMCEGPDGWRADTYHDGGRGAYSDHLASALTAAGFGDVREAKAQSLEEAADERAERSDTYFRTMQDMADSREYELADIVRYGAYSAEAKSTAAWLRARAAAVRGEG